MTSRTRIARERRGFALLLVVMLLSVLFGTAAFSIDFGRMFTFRSQLRAASDAVALAAVQRVAMGDGGSALATALQLAGTFRVGDSMLVMTDADVLPACYDGRSDVVSLASPCNSWTSPNVNAAQVTARYTAGYTFGRIFGATTSQRTSISVATVGSVRATAGFRPWAVSYRDLLRALDLKDGGTRMSSCFGFPVYCDWVLRPADLQVLKLMGPADAVQLGEFYPDTAGAADESGKVWRVSVGGTYGQAIASGGSSTVVSNGWMSADASGRPLEAAGVLCAPTTPCGIPPIRVAVYDSTNHGGGAALQVHVKYLSLFVPTYYDNTVTPEVIRGYFTALPGRGQFTAAIGPITKLALIR